MYFLTAFGHVKRHFNVLLPTALLLLIISDSTSADNSSVVASKVENSSQSLDHSNRSAPAVAVSSESKPLSSSPHDAIPNPVNAKQNDTSKSSKNLNNPKAPPGNANAGEAHSIVNIPEDPSVELSKKLNPEALMRAFYVFIGLSAIVMVYFAWKSLGKRPTHIHRYGVVANREDLEMAPLDSDDAEEDDTTHFDISKHRLK